MASTKLIEKSKYKGVAKIMQEGKYIYYRCSGNVNGRKFHSIHETEREAAISYDKKMLENKREAVNILIPKSE
jgi:hypothetical protein